MRSEGKSRNQRPCSDRRTGAWREEGKKLLCGRAERRVTPPMLCAARPELRGFLRALQWPQCSRAGGGWQGRLPGVSCTTPAPCPWGPGVVSVVRDQVLVWGHSRTQQAAGGAADKSPSARGEGSGAQPLLSANQSAARLPSKRQPDLTLGTRRKNGISCPSLSVPNDKQKQRKPIRQPGTSAFSQRKDKHSKLGSLRGALSSLRQPGTNCASGATPMQGSELPVKSTRGALEKGVLKRENRNADTRGRAGASQLLRASQVPRTGSPRRASNNPALLRALVLPS